MDSVAFQVTFYLRNYDKSANIFCVAQTLSTSTNNVSVVQSIATMLVN